MNLLGLSPVLAIVVGVRRNRPAVARPVVLLRARPRAVLARRPLHVQLPEAARTRRAVPVARRRRLPRRLPGADGRPAACSCAGATRSATAPASIDSLIMTLGLALLSWVALIAPYLHDDGADAGREARLDRLPARRHPAARRRDPPRASTPARASRRSTCWRRASSRCWSPTSSTGCSRCTAPTTTSSGSTSAGSPSTCCGAPRRCTRRCASSSEPAPDRESRLTPLRLALLTGASLIAPAIELVREVSDGDRRPGSSSIVRRRSSCSASWWRAWPGSCASRSARSRASASLSAAGAALVAATDARGDLRRRPRCGASSPAPAPRRGSACARGRRSSWPTPRSAPRGRSRPRPSRCSRPRATAVAALDERCAPAARRPSPTRSSCRWRSAARPTACSWSRRARRPADCGACTRWRPGLARARERGADRGGPPRAERGALRLARPARQRPDHRARRRRRGRSTRARRSSACSATRRRSSSARRFDELLAAAARRAGSLHLLADGADDAGRGARSLECALRHRDGSVRQFEVLHTNLLDDEHVRGIVLNGRDVSERKAFEEQLAHQAFHDPVTSLANRALFVERVRHAHRRAPRRERRGPGRDLPRPRRLQDDQRQPRPRRRRRRCCCEVAKRLDDGIRAERHRRALRRRRVRGPARGRRQTPRRPPTPPSGSSPRSPSRSSGPARSCSSRASLGISIADGDGADRRRRADPQRRRRDVHRQARRQGRLPAVRARDARGRARAPRAARRPAAGARRRRARAALPAGRAPRRRRRLGRRGAAALAPPRARPRSSPTASSRSPRRRA